MVWVVAVAMAQPADETIVLKEGLQISVPGNGRTPVAVDPVIAGMIEGKVPSEATGWRRVEAAADGWFRGNGYVYATVPSEREQIMLLEATGTSQTWVNEEPRAGDPYGYGYLSLPVRLKAGTNEFYFQVGRGQMRASLIKPPAPVSFDTRDATLPDVVTGAPASDAWAGVVIRNAQDEWGEGLEVTAEHGGQSRTTKVPHLWPLGVRNVPVKVPRPQDADGKVVLTLRKGGEVLHKAELNLRVVKPEEARRVTFISRIDKSVQYYGYLPASDSKATSVILSPHGASVEALGQAQAYGAKTWAHVVAPTNRRPYGFDWEEIGRLDLLEVRDLALEIPGVNPDEVYISGHSMGGHGSWINGALFPFEFAGVGPCAGWASFFTYGGGRRWDATDPMGALLNRVSQIHDTMLFKDNLRINPVYVLHGDADETVPVSEARNMRKALEGHPALGFHEEAGQGHWYDTDPAPGANCLDHAPMWEFLRANALNRPDDYTLTTIDPSINGNFGWVTVHQQAEPYQPSTITVAKGEATTTNITLISLDLGETMKVDGQALTSGHWRRDGAGQWQRLDEVPTNERSAVRGGRFKDVFYHRPTVVNLDRDQRDYAFQIARFWAETFYYRGNGDLNVMFDGEDEDVNPIYIGGPDFESESFVAAANSASEMRIGSDPLPGAGAGLSIAPVPGAPDRMQALVSYTDRAGALTLARLPIWTPGAAFPDVFVVGPEMLRDGISGVRAAAILDSQYRLEPKMTVVNTPKAYVAPFWSQEPPMDGDLSHESWQLSPWTDDFVDIEGDKRPVPRFRTRAKMGWSESGLWIGAEMEEPHVWGTLTEHDSVIFHDNDFEVFIDPDDDALNYGELELNALNTTWDLLLPRPYREGGPAVDSWEIKGLRTAVKINGTLNDPSDEDEGWSCTIHIPWRSLKEISKVAVPPQPGDRWRINFSRVQWQHFVENGKYRKVPDTKEDNWVWSPQGVVDMHQPEMWGYLEFAR